MDYHLKAVKQINWHYPKSQKLIKIIRQILFTPTEWKAWEKNFFILLKTIKMKWDKIDEHKFVMKSYGSNSTWQSNDN